VIHESSPPAASVAVQLLGSLRASIGEAELDLVTPMHRALLAILAVNANAVVSTEQLIDEMWQRNPPDGARATLQSYVSVLRRKCRDLGRPDLIETRPPGYVLRLANADLDVAGFRSHIAAARHADAAGAHADRHQHLREAVGLVGYEVLSDLDHLDTVRVFVADVDEHRRWAIQQLAELELGNGRSVEMIPMLQEAVRRHPLEERTWGLLIRSFHQSGRQGDALRSYQDLRHVLRDELGVEPCAELQAIERSVLEGAVDKGERRRQPDPTTRTVRAPHPRTPLVGRVGELVDIEEAVTTHRLVTITGPGGCGKTRLAAEAAQTLSSTFDDVVWVELNNLEKAAGVDDAVAAALGLFRRSADGLVELVADHLGDRSALLIIDNCEHVIDAAADTSAALLATSPGLIILATSRERLSIGGEYVLALPPLASAGPLELTRSQFEKPSEAATLFIDRAGIRAPDTDNLAVIEAICAQLDGIPLAIELAAPLVQLMSFDEIADRLLDRFRLLGETHRSGRPQHRTLRAVVEWSHDLLDNDERTAFAALSVFRGPFTMDAAKAVIGAVGEDALATLPGLVRKSVVLADTGGSVTRYRMLETLRAFAAEQLEFDAVGHAAAHTAFVRHFAGQAQRWARQQQTATVSAWLNELGPDIANFQAAVARSRETDPSSALTMIDAFQWYFNYIGQMAETRRWLAGLTAEADLPLEERTIATLCQASLANFGGDYGATGELAESALAAARQLGDIKRLNAALIIRGTTATFEGNGQRAAECFMESAHLSEELSDLGGIAASMAFWGVAHRRSGDFDEAKRCFDRAFEGFSRLSDDRGMALVMGNSGRMAHQLGDIEQGRELTRRALEMARKSLDPVVSAQCALFCGHIAFDSGQVEEAITLFEAALRHAMALDNRTMTSAAIEWLVLVGGGRAEDVVLIDAFTRVRRNSPGTASPRPDWDAALIRAQEQLGSERCGGFEVRGKSMTMGQAIEHARAAAATAK
jgi:predicted ATPase/DNA-binding SARP family transcriptional activator